MEYYKTIKLRINCNKTDLDKLYQCNKESAMIWNECIKKNNELFSTQNKLMNKSELEKFVQTLNTKVICARNKQVVAQKVFDAYKGISKARKSGREDLKYPYKEKRFYPTEWGTHWVIFPNYEMNEIKITTARYIGEDNKPHNGKQIRLKFKAKIPNNIKTIKLIYEHGWFYACISYTEDIIANNLNTENISSIDLGEIHSITSIDNNLNQLIITGRKIRAIKQFRNKKYAELSEKLSKCNKGSRQYKKYLKAKRKIGSKCQRQLYYCIHKLTKEYGNWCVEKGISTVLIGDVEGIEQNTKQEHKGNSNTRQKLSQWDYGKISLYLGYKLNLLGINLIKVSESYTSQLCPACGSLNKPKGRNYKCDCGYHVHRDLNGAYNILRLNTNLKLPLIEKENIKYLRIV